MNFAWPVLKSWQSTLGLQSICSVESTSYSYHRIYSSCKKCWKETENRNGSIEISSQPQLIPTIKKKKILMITLFMMEIAFLFIELFIYQTHQESYYVSIKMYIFAKEMANS